MTATNVIGTGPLSAASSPVTPTATTIGPIKGYWMVTSEGAVLTNGAAVSYGSPAGLALGAPIVSLVPTPDRKGYWIVGADGGVFNYGDAGFYGSAGSEHLNSPIVGMAATSDGKGYWLVASDGGVFAYGDASVRGLHGRHSPSTPRSSASPATGRPATCWSAPTVASSPSARPRSTARPAQSTSSPRSSASSALANGSGYYLAAADGGVFAYDAPFLGSAPRCRPTADRRHRRRRGGWLHAGRLVGCDLRLPERQLLRQPGQLRGHGPGGRRRLVGAATGRPAGQPDVSGARPVHPGGRGELREDHEALTGRTGRQHA